MTQLLIVEDNVGFATGLAANLRSEGFDVLVAHDGMAGVRHVRQDAPDLVLLDLMLPGRDGYEVLRILRDEANDVPVVVLTARRDEDDKLRSYRLGADEYVTKPVSVLELTARVRAVLRRAHAAGTGTDSVIRIGQIEIDIATRTVRVARQVVSLRRKEYELLMALAHNQGRIVSRDELLREVWGYHPDTVSRTVDTHILALRSKLEEDPLRPRHVLTARTAGYYLKT